MNWTFSNYIAVVGRKMGSCRSNRRQKYKPTTLCFVICGLVCGLVWFVICDLVWFLVYFVLIYFIISYRWVCYLKTRFLNKPLTRNKGFITLRIPIYYFIKLFWKYRYVIWCSKFNINIPILQTIIKTNKGGVRTIVFLGNWEGWCFLIN